MSNYEITDVKNAAKLEAKPLSVKQAFGNVHSIEEMMESWVFYSPVTHYLICDPNRVCISTDIFSSILAPVLGEHPLVIDGLLRPIFQNMSNIILSDDQRSFTRKVYAVPKQVWEATEARLQLVQAADMQTRRLCLFVPHIELVDSPFSIHSNEKLKVHFFNVYGNSETYYFDKENEGYPNLLYHPPVTEIVEIADRLFNQVVSKNKIIGERVTETFAMNAAQFAERHEFERRVILAQKENKLDDAVKRKPLSESQLTIRQKEECELLIHQYKEMWADEQNAA